MPIMPAHQIISITEEMVHVPSTLLKSRFTRLGHVYLPPILPTTRITHGEFHRGLMNNGRLSDPAFNTPDFLCNIIEPLLAELRVNGVICLTYQKDWTTVGQPHRVDPEQLRYGHNVHFDGRPGNVPYTILIADHIGARAWRGDYDVQHDGGPFPLRNSFGDEVSPDMLIGGEVEILQPHTAYLLHPYCIHEGMRQPQSVLRTFLRISVRDSSADTGILSSLFDCRSL